MFNEMLFLPKLHINQMPEIMQQQRLETCSDAELIQLFHCSPGQRESVFSEIYRRYAQRIKIYCVRVVGSEEDGSDIFQETFVRFFRAAFREPHEKTMDKPIDNIGGYVMRIARNLCLNHKRDTKSTVTIDEWERAMPDFPNYEREELLNLIAVALEYLEFDYREAFVLRFYQGYSYEEIAELTGASISTVTNRIWRAKDKLKTVLKPYLADLEEFAE
jgi:RNA polymerase sigma-70 factor (ECF subfamily)